MPIFSASYRNPNTTLITAPAYDDVERVSCDDIVTYVIENHNIDVPVNFSKTLNRAHHEHHSSLFHMPTKVVDQIVRACEIWKEFILAEDFDKLVCHQLVEMARIHTSVLYARKRDWWPVHFVKEPPYELETIVNYNGSIQIRGRS